MVNFSHLLNKPADEAKRPEALPDGTYYGTIQGYEFGESSQKKTPFIQFNLVLTHADDGTDTEGVDPAGRKMRNTLYITDDAMWRLREFLEGLGINVAGRKFDELVPQTVGQSVMVDVVKKPNNSGDGFFNETRKVSGMQSAAEAPAEAPVSRRRGQAA